jgi:hypothetical protein
MLLKEIPELRPWPPSPACPPPTPKADEVLRLTLKNVILTNQVTLTFNLNYGDGTCSFSAEFKDHNVAVALSNALQRHLGQSLQEIGNLEIYF